jgi:6-phosphogluconolactonase
VSASGRGAGRPSPAFWVASRDGGVAHLEVRDGRLHRRGHDLILGEDLAAVVAHPDGRWIYASVRSLPGIVRLSVDPDTGQAERQDVLRYPARFVHLSISPAGDALIGADYAGEVAIFPLADGRLDDRSAVRLRPGRHPHAAVAGADRLWIGLLGEDAVLQVPLKEARPAIADATRTQLPEGFGPRHIALTAAGAVVIGERQGALARIPRGAREPDAIWSILPEGLDLAPGIVRATPAPEPTHAPDGRPLTWAADLAVSADGHTVYASERRTSQLSISRLGPGGGRLVRSVETEPRPRALALDRSARWLLVSGELADTVTLYDAADHDLPVVDRCPVARGAVWVQGA